MKPGAGVSVERPMRPIIFICALLPVLAGWAAESLSQRIDKLIAAKAGRQPLAEPASDSEFLRRVYLDFTGQIPTADGARKFLANPSADKRAKLIDQLFADVVIFWDGCRIHSHHTRTRSFGMRATTSTLACSIARSSPGETFPTFPQEPFPSQYRGNLWHFRDHRGNLPLVGCTVGGGGGGRGSLWQHPRNGFPGNPFGRRGFPGNPSAPRCATRFPR